MNTNSKQSKLLEDRTVNFSVSIINRFSPLAKKSVLQPIVIQIIKSSTSIGANYAEANNSSSVQDFKSKIFIAKKEAAETRYWINIFQKLLPDEDFSSLSQEALELNLILQKIISTIKANANNGK